MVPKEGYTTHTFIDLGVSKTDLFGSGLFLGVFARNVLDDTHFVVSVEGPFVEEVEGFTLTAKLGKAF